MSVYKETHLPRPVRHPRAASAGTVKWVGRFTLWSTTCALFLIVVSGITALLWALTPLAQAPTFVTIHRLTLTATFLAAAVAFANLFFVHRWLVPPRNAFYRSLEGARVHVGLTAWNDQESIGLAVREFKACPDVHRVIVVDNNSSDATARIAAEAGADEVVIETIPGYGSCCMRALAEAAQDADVIILCEGDMTFSARDVKKFLAYLENCDLVLGTRATQELRDHDTQMDWLLNPGNQIVAKLVQTRFWGTRLTDMGCTYRAIRVEAYRRLKGHLRVRGSHFSPHMFIEALKMAMRVIEIPVFFRARIGDSKGVGSNKIKAARVALKMIGLIYKA
ncbi:MAG TPA: glycosyltransferase family 2 protein [Isosphaeraceae bacterium]|nr:glycosyltransferase family 2 protein [Isosphaeraceae bacterium]